MNTGDVQDGGFLGGVQSPTFQFAGINYWGGDNFPRDVPMGVDYLRQWALDNGLVHEEDQFITPEQIDQLSKVFSTEDKLWVVIHISKDPDGNLSYLEYPGIPVATLINKALEPDLVYWRCFPSKVEFGFWLKDSPGTEFASDSHGKFVVPKFSDKLLSLKREGCFTTEIQDSEFSVGEEIDVSEQEPPRTATAFFKKSGRAHDVDILVNAVPPGRA